MPTDLKMFLSRHLSTVKKFCRGDALLQAQWVTTPASMMLNWRWVHRIRLQFETLELRRADHNYTINNNF